MKKLILFITGVIVVSGVLAQAPQGITNQGVVRDSNNQVLVNTSIGKRVSILQGAVDGSAVYVETHSLTTNANGLITYIIGDGNAVEGSFADIDWSDGPYWLETKADPEGGTDYTITGVTQFLSVPYAMHSETAKTLSEEIVETDPVFMDSPAAGILLEDIDNWDEAHSWGDHNEEGYLTEVYEGVEPGEMKYWDGENWVPIEPGEHEQTLRLCDGVPRWGPCFYELALFADPLWGGTVTGEGEYDIGTEVSITAIPNQGWEFINWTGDIEHLVDENSAESVLMMPADNVALTAIFQVENDLDFIYGDGVTDIDGNEYVTVIIGEQEWMAENLRVTRDADENDITRYCYDDEETNCELYGGLYTFLTATNGQSSSSNPSGVQGICPDGWHVPSDAEWTELLDYLDSQGFPNSDVTGGAGNALKSCRQVDHPDGAHCETSEHPRWDSDITHHGFDEFGFSALPGGRGFPTDFDYIGHTGSWWSSNAEGITGFALGVHLKYNSGDVGIEANHAGSSYSLRCVRD